eukprot:tig00000823_g4545.t1
MASLFESIQQVASGFGKQDMDLPIDINLNKMLDWLVDRRKVSAKWQQSIKVAQAKAAAALQMLPKELNVHPEGAPLTYVDCARIQATLKALPSAQQPAWRTMRAWADVLRTYEKEGLHLAEGTSILVQNVSYEIPFVKKTIAKCAKELEELDRREVDLNKAAALADKKFKELCDKLRIAGEKPRAELVACVAELPGICEATARAIAGQPIREARALYDGFVNTVVLEQAAGKRGASLPTLGHIADHLEEVVQASASAGLPASEASASGPSIDWGDGGGGGGGGGANIDWGIETTGGSGGGGGATIDWGITSEGGEGGSGGGAGPSIDWGITSDGGAGEAPKEIGIDWGEGAGGAEAPAAPAAAGPAGKKSLDAAEFRAAAIDELLELQAFLRQRSAELEGKGDAATQAAAEQLQMHLLNRASSIAPAVLQHDHAPSVAAYRAAVDAALAAIDGAHARHVLLVRGSSKYVDRLVASVEQAKAQGGKLRAMAAGLSQKRGEVQARNRAAQPQLEALLGATRQLKGALEQQISAMYHGRVVHIIGEINTLLAAAPPS